MSKSPRTLAFTALVSVVYHAAFPQLAVTNIALAGLVDSVEIKTVADYSVPIAVMDGLATVSGTALITESYPDTPQVAYVAWVLTTAYSSTPDQTDDSPFITASGTHVHDGTLACNFLRFGTRVKIPQYYGDKVFIVEDRMAKRNSHKMDIWMETREQAIQFGARTVKVEVLIN